MAKKLIKPLLDRVLLRPLPAEEISAGGIVLPGAAQEKQMLAEVLEVGPGALSDDGKRLPMSASKGDTVVIGQYAGQKIKIDGEELVVAKDGELLAIVA